MPIIKKYLIMQVEEFQINEKSIEKSISNIFGKDCIHLRIGVSIFLSFAMSSI